MTDVMKTTTLEERITERLHASIGELITDADLAKLVERGVENALWRPRVVEHRTTWGHIEHITKPALVDELVERLLSTRMEAAVNAWLAANPEKLQAAVDAAIAAGAGEAFMKYLDLRFANLFQYGVESLRNQGLLPR